MISQERYCSFEDGGFVHFTVRGGDHGAELVDQHVELIAPLLFTQITRLPTQNESSTVITQF